MAKLQLLVLVIACYISYGSARPTIESDGSRRLSHHDRASSVRRHADVNLSTELAKMLRLHKRIDVLRKLIATAERGNTISVERVMQMAPHKSRRILRKLKQEGVQGVVGFQVMPRKDLIPDHQETSERLLLALNGEHKDDNLRVRVVDHRPNTAPRHMDEFIRKADELRQSALTARTCLELQKTILKLPSLRIKVRCKSGPPKRRSTATRALSRPVGLHSYTPQRRLHLNGHVQHNALRRRHTRRYYRPG